MSLSENFFNYLNQANGYNGYALGLQQQQSQAQGLEQYYRSMLGSGQLGTSVTANGATSYITVAPTYGIATPPRAKTNVDWLDERVNEIRVKL